MNTAGEARARLVVTSTIGVSMILGWGSSFYLLAVLAPPIAKDTGWPLSWIVGALSIGFIVSGLVSPRVGRAVEQYGGRSVLAIGAATMGLGLLLLAVAPTLLFYVFAWIVLGVGMGAGLYDAAMATLGRLYGAAARRPITLLTLYGGFASTACWPLSAFLVEQFGWRGTCLAYAALHLLLSVPLYLLLLPREAAAPVALAAATKPRPAGRPPGSPLFFLVALSMMLSWGTTAVIGVHLLTILGGLGIAATAAVALGTLVGPSQVAARFLEMVLGVRFHPIWTMIASTVLVTAGLALLFGHPYAIALGIIVYGAGNGLASIVRGTLPLALFGAEGYATLMGRLGRPLNIAFAVSPSLAAVILDRYGEGALVATLVSIAVANVAISGVVAISVWRGEKNGTG